MVCRQCKSRVPSDHQGSRCPVCGEETVFDLAVQPAPDEIRPQDYVRMGSGSEKWIWSLPYVIIVAAATLGSLIFCLIPGWGMAAGALCTLVSTLAGFKAGTKYRKEVIWS
jgi:hypothetical protein